MKFSQRLLCALCAFTLLLGCFSFTAKAETHSDVGATKVFGEAWLTSPYSDMFPATPQVSATVYSGENNIRNSKELNTSSWGEKTLSLNFRYSFTSALYAKIFSAGEEVTFQADGLAGSLSIVHPNGIPQNIYLSSKDYIDYENVVAYLRYTDGTSEQITGYYYYDIYDQSAGFSASFTPKYDVRAICFEVSTKNRIGFMQAPLSAHLEVGANALNFNIKIKDQEQIDTGNFFERIIKKIQAFREDLNEKITAGNNQSLSIFEKLSLTAQYVFDLPQRIWSYMKNGLINLFVPDDMYMEQWVERNKEWCTETFGALYQSFDIIVNAYANIDASAETHVIDFPLVTIPLPENQEFTFGGYEVKIVPEGFEFLATICKSVVGIVCSFAFINGMRRRYDDIMEETK